MLPSGDPRDVRGGTGFNDAEEIGPGVWRDRILPAQTLWYEVPAGWGRQVRHDVEFANGATVERGASITYSYGATQLFMPARFPLAGGGEFSPTTLYGGRPAARAADIARNPQVGVVLRVSVLGDEPAGPQRNAPVAAKKADKKGNPITAGDSGGTGGAGWTGIAAAAGAGAVVVVIAGLVFVRGRRGRAAQTTRGSA
ncbi:hypothetical protein [Streptomyces sp. NPDC001966]